MKLGVGIISWNRPNYLKKTIKSLEKNNLKNTEFHLFQDGYECTFTEKNVANPKDITDSIKIFYKSKLTNKSYHLRTKNVSIAINQFEAMKFLRKHYKYFLFIENDVIFNKNFISLMKKLLKIFENDKRVACISPGFKLWCHHNDINYYKNKLFLGNGHFWIEACWANKWKKIEKEYMAYYNLVKNQPYNKRPVKKIKKLFQKTGHKMPATSQDNGKDWAIKMTDMKRTRLVVNRATGIGDKGFHSTKEKLAKSGDGHNKVYSFDNEINNYKILGERKKRFSKRK